MTKPTNVVAAAALAASLFGATSANAAIRTFDFDWVGQMAGFTVKGSFSYDDVNVDSNGLIREESLEAFSISFYDPNSVHLATYDDSHIVNPDFNFAFDATNYKILQDGKWDIDDDVDLEKNGLNVGLGTPKSGPSGWGFWSTFKLDSSPHMHVDQWDDADGYRIGYSTHEDVGFIDMTTLELINTGKTIEYDIDELASGLGEYGSRITVSSVPLPPALVMFIGGLLALVRTRRRA
ncbi:MAG: VPLPA-CTERM sorting domain-containing protein [Pseudomonadota bacterium]